MDAVIASPTTNAKLRAWVDEMTALCKPDEVVWTDGTQQEYDQLCQMMVDAVSTRDLPLIQSCAIIFCFGYLFLTTTADIIAILSNPRLR